LRAKLVSRRTTKLKRTPIAAEYEAEIEALYA